MAIKKSDLYSSIWASCDELRGGMDASQYKDYVLFMLASPWARAVTAIRTSASPGAYRRRSRRNLVRSGVLKGIIGLPANLFYGTGILACIVVLDKENADARKGVFMIDASKGLRKDGPKNRLRDQDIHRIVDVFRRRDEHDPRYARMVPLAEIADAKNDYNLNLPRYIDSSEPEDLQDIDGHLRGGIPERDLDAFADYWRIMPALRAALFEALRPGYSRLRLPLAELKAAIFGHAEFTAFHRQATQLLAHWRAVHTPLMKAFGKDGHPKALIETSPRACSPSSGPRRCSTPTTSTST
jgi:type I restriction enzyme M protein